GPRAALAAGDGAAREGPGAPAAFRRRRRRDAEGSPRRGQGARGGPARGRPRPHARVPQRASPAPDARGALARAAGRGAAVPLGQRSDALALLRPADGALQASFELAAEASQPPLFTHGRVFVTSGDGALQALSWPGGEPLWRREDEDVVGGAPYGRDVVVAAG